MNVSIPELETVELAVVLTVGGAEEVTSSGTFDNGLRDYPAILKTWEVKITKRVLPEIGGFDRELIGLPLQVFEFGAQMDR